MFKKIIFSAILVASFSGLKANYYAGHSFPIGNIEQMNQLITLSAGTAVFVSLNQTVSGDEVSVGNAIDFLVRSNVTVNGKVVIAAGATATGWVKSVKKSCSGKCAEITISVESAQAVDGQSVNLRSVPHTLKAPCCGSDASQIEIGTSLQAKVLNDIKINA